MSDDTEVLGLASLRWMRGRGKQIAGMTAGFFCLEVDGGMELA